MRWSKLQLKFCVNVSSQYVIIITANYYYAYGTVQQCYFCQLGWIPAVHSYLAASAVFLTDNKF